MQLNKRDKTALIAGSVAVLFFLVIQFAVLPFLSERKRLQKGITSRQTGLLEMKQLRQRYDELHNRAGEVTETLKMRAPGFSLFSFLEKMATEVQIKDRIAYMKPSEQTDKGEYRESLVEMKLQAVSLQQLVDFLEKIESPENVVTLRRLSIQENKKEEASLDAIMQVFTIKQS